MKRYKFKPMLGPASQHPEGTSHWAECFGNELQYTVMRAEDYAVDDVIDLLRRLVNQNLPPWNVWPDPPCKTFDAYLQLCTGKTTQQILCLIEGYKGDIELGKQIRALCETD